MMITLITRGSKFSIDVGTQETILEIKKRIQHSLGIPVNSQTITVFDWELIDGLDLSDYPLISDGTTMHLTTTPPSPPPLTDYYLTTKMRIIVKFSARKIEIEADKTDTLLSLKEKIHIVEGTSIKRMTLSFNGAHMSDEFRSLSEYGIVEGSEIAVFLKTVGHVAACDLPTRRVRVIVQTSTSLMDGARIPVEMIDSCRVEEMRRGMVERGMLPEDEYIFIHKQRIMKGDCSLRWHGVEDGDFVYVFKGTVSRGEFY